MLQIILNIFISISYAQLSPLLIEKVATSFIEGDLETCNTYSIDCKRLFELTIFEDTSNLITQLKGTSVFLPVNDLTKMCSNANQDACNIISASFNDAQDDCQKFSKEYNSICSDMRSFRLNACQKIEDPFLGSVCSKKILPSCHKDLACLVAWSYAFREDAERFKLTPPEIQKAFIAQYQDDKKTIKNNLKNLNPNVVKVSEFIPAITFPAPGKLLNFTAPISNFKIKNTSPKFKPLVVLDSVFTPGARKLLHPWRKEERLTVADWNGDGFLDIFSLDGSNVAYFENIKGTGLKKFSLELSAFGIKPTLVDISIADIDGEGVPAILIQSLPRSLYILRWQSEKKSFLVEQVTLPNFSQSHTYVKLKNELGIIFPGWAGIASSPDNMANDYLAKIKNKKWSFEKISTSKSPSFGANVVEKNNEQTVVVINKDHAGGTDVYRVGDEGLIKSPDTDKLNYYSTSSAYWKTAKGDELWITAGMSFLGEKNTHPEPSFRSSFKKIEDCKKGWSKNDQDFCVIKFNTRLTSFWPSLCLEYKNPDHVRLCLMQNEDAGIKGIKMKDPAKYTAQVLKNIESPIIDEAGSKVISQLGQIVHISPLQSPSLEGFLATEVPRNGSPSKLWWISTSGGVIQKFDLTGSLGLKKPFDSTNFALADFDKDGQLDMVFRNGSDLVVLKGDTSGSSELKDNLQSGYQSRTLINIFKNSKLP